MSDYVVVNRAHAAVGFYTADSPRDALNIYIKEHPLDDFSNAEFGVFPITTEYVYRTRIYYPDNKVVSVLYNIIDT